MEAQKYLPHYTYEDYRHWEGQWELIYGVPYSMAPSPGMYHQKLNERIVSQLTRNLEDCARCEAFLPIDWRIADDIIVQPDALVVCQPFEMGTFLSKTPILVFEIFSPSSVEKDRNLKFSIYEKEGVKYYVMINPLKKTAEVYLLEDRQYKLQTEVNTGDFTFELDDCHIAFDFGKIW